MKQLLSLLVLLLLFSCVKNKPVNDNTVLDYVKQSNDSLLQHVFNSRDNYKLQILLTIVEHDKAPLFKTYEYNVNDSSYFYPASTVKLPVALFALEEINSLPFNSKTPYFIEGDSTTSNLREDVKAIFTVSDNAAYNRLYEFLGSDKINQYLTSKELLPTKIVHRLSVENADDRALKPVIFFENDSILYSTKDHDDAPIDELRINDVFLGKGYYEDESLIEEPMRFSQKNFFPLRKQHEILQRLFYPNEFEKDKQFHLDTNDLVFLKKCMKTVPRKAGYNEEEYNDGYVKFFIYGDTKEQIPETISIYNKVGYAYGFLTDNAYIVDRENNIAFFLSATIHVNKNDIYNDNTYEYETIGLPFLAKLGREIYYFLLERGSKNH